MEHVNCDFCGSSEARVLFRGSDRMFPKNDALFSVQQCFSCGLLYLQPRPTTHEELLAMYPPEYDSYVNLDKKWQIALRKLVWRGELLDIRKRIGSEGNVLEIGCATGEYLNALREKGVQNVTGVEFSPQAAELARTRYEMSIVTGDLFDGHFPDSAFDAIVMRHVLEHIPSPFETLREINRIIKPGGWLFLSLPNPDSLEAKLFKENWLDHDVPRHLFNFPPATLRKMLSRTGFEQYRIDYSNTPNGWILSSKYYLFSRRLPAGLTRMLDLNNPLSLALFIPLSILAGFFRCSGRIRVVARKLAAMTRDKS